MTRILTAATILASAGIASAADFHTTTGFQSAYLYSVSNEGTATGDYATEHAIWNPIGGVQVGIGGVAFSGRPMISDDGRYIGGTAAGPDGRAEIGRYDRNTGMWTTFGGTGGYSGSTRSSAWGISPDGSTVVGFGYGAPTGGGTSTGIHPAAWTEGVGLVNYSYNPTATSVNRIEAASNNGVMAGYARFPSSSSASSGVFWSSGPGSQQGLAYSTGYLNEAVSISADGGVIGGHGSTLTRVTATVPTSLPYLYDTDTGNVTLIDSIAGINGNSFAGVASADGLLTGMSGDGDTAVGFFRGRNSFNTPLIDKVWGFIWTATDGVVPFDTFVADLGAPDTDLYYYVPSAISGDGSIIAGYRYIKGTPTVVDSFMITNIPAPSSLALVGLSAVFGSRRRRR